MSGWVQVDIALPRHPRLMSLARHAGLPRTHAVGVLTVLWGSVRDAECTPTDYTVDDLEVLADWDGPSGALATALVETGWVSVGEDGGITGLRGWARYESADEKREETRRRDRERKRKARGVRAESHRTSAGIHPLEEEVEEEVENIKEATSVASCSEPEPGPEPVALDDFPVVGKGASSWVLTERHALELAEAYPGVDVLAEARRARQWLRDNPTKRKTARGMRRFFGAWCERAQNRGGARGHGPPPQRFRAETVAQGLFREAEEDAQALQEARGWAEIDERPPLRALEGGDHDAA